MNFQADPQAWYKNTNRETLDDRIKSVQNVNDPTIIADDVQRWSTRFLWLLLAFTTLLSGFSYYKFFENSFGVFAIAMAISLAVTIEFGKNWAFLKVLRIPFFLGWGHIQKEVQETIMWGGLFGLSAVCFAASVYNSTHGAQQLALMLGNERNYQEFKPNTAGIDAQILAHQESISQNRAIKWKGTTTYQAQRAVSKETTILDKLQTEKAKALELQRKDWEEVKATKSGQNSFSAGSLLLVGGFVELLQFLLMFMRVSAERSLDKTASARSATRDTGGGAGFQDVPKQKGAFAENAGRSTMGFYWDGYGSAKAQAPTVPQTKTFVTQPTQQFYTVLGSDQILLQLRTRLMADIPNLRRKNGVMSTISGRINRAFDQCREAMEHPDFKPSRETGALVYGYLATEAIPALNGAGWPYELDTFFMRRLLDVIPKAA